MIKNTDKDGIYLRISDAFFSAVILTIILLTISMDVRADRNEKLVILKGHFEKFKTNFKQKSYPEITRSDQFISLFLKHEKKFLLNHQIDKDLFAEFMSSTDMLKEGSELEEVLYYYSSEVEVDLERQNLLHSNCHDRTQADSLLLQLTKEILRIQSVPAENLHGIATHSSNFKLVIMKYQKLMLKDINSSFEKYNDNAGLIFHYEELQAVNDAIFGLSEVLSSFALSMEKTSPSNQIAQSFKSSVEKTNELMSVNSLILDQIDMHLKRPEQRLLLEKKLSHTREIRNQFFTEYQNFKNWQLKLKKDDPSRPIQEHANLRKRYKQTIGELDQTSDVLSTYLEKTQAINIPN